MLATTFEPTPVSDVTSPPGINGLSYLLEITLPEFGYSGAKHDSITRGGFYHSPREGLMKVQEFNQLFFKSK
jgi:hypothetical protein